MQGKKGSLSGQVFHGSVLDRVHNFGPMKTSSVDKFRFKQGHIWTVPKIIREGVLSMHTDMQLTFVLC